MEHNVDYKRLAIDCEEYALACYKSKLWALASHERTCRDAILGLLARAEAAEKQADIAECRCGEEIRRRKATEIRAENAESQVKMPKLANDDLWQKREGLYCMAQVRTNAIKRAAEIEEIYVKLQTVTGITPERMLELFLEGYTLQPTENLNLANLLKGNQNDGR